MAINDWNLHQGSGAEILESILKFSNKDYNFKKILGPVDSSALADIFLKNEGQKFEFQANRQSSVYFAYFNLTCKDMQFESFYKELIQLSLENQIPLDLEEIEKM